jgi:hypothetical protein
MSTLVCPALLEDFEEPIKKRGGVSRVKLYETASVEVAAILGKS